MSNNHVSVRLDQETMARVETLAPLFSTRWRRATRSDIFRALILTALEGYERDPATLQRLAAERASAAAARAKPARRPRPAPEGARVPAGGEASSVKPPSPR